MKKIIHPAYIVIFCMLIFYSTNTNAQCAAGTGTRDTLQWDYLDFLPNTGSYVTPTAYINLAQSQTQRFTFATQKVTITHNYSGSDDPGENGTHTGSTGTYGNGDDLQFIGDGAVTFTFQNAVKAIKFSIYDIDKSQRIVISSAAAITVTTLTGTILSLTNNNTTAVRIDAANSTVSPTVNSPTANGTVNVDIPAAAGVTSFTITVTNTSTCNSGCGTGGKEDGSYWISDVSACNVGTFTNNYYNVSKPYTGQAAYVLAVRNDSVYYVNIANGIGKFLFADYGNDYINSMGYDPVRHFVYYTYSLSAAGGTVSSTDRVLRRYDYDKDTLGVVSNDVRTLGIPLYDQSIESGAAAFYDGSLYLGIEGGNSVTDRESTVWKLDFNGSFQPSGLASQAFAIESDDHDWADFGINNGMLYDFDGSASGTDFYHKDLVTGSTVHYAPSPSTLVPRQVGIDWTGQVYNIGSPSTIAAGTLVPYNNNGSVGSGYNISFMGTNPVGSWGDAAEAFKPKTDFGDAPASYDPAGSDPATTELSDSLRLGATKPSIEWAKKTSVDASGDGAEEDGLSGPQIISTGPSNFTLPVKVFNNTGFTATLAGWIDKNGDGVFTSGEGVTASVPSSGVLQTINLFWSGINVTLVPTTITFMRLRISSNEAGIPALTTSNPTGFFPFGEVEDYKVTVSIVLADQNVSLKAQKVNAKNVNLTWIVNDENEVSKYELQRSNDGTNNWQTINERTVQGNTAGATYSFVDIDPNMPVSYFRVKTTKNSGVTLYSEIKRIDFDKANSISVSPNPAKDISKINIQAANAGLVHINVLDYTGRVVSDESVKVIKGANSFDLPVVKKISNGVYKVRAQLEDEILITTLVVIK